MIASDDRDFKLVRSAVYLCRLAGERPSAMKVIAAVKAVSGRGLRKADVCRLMKILFQNEQMVLGVGNRSGTEAELSGTEPEPISSTPGTEPEQTGTEPEHHARIRNQKQEIEIDSIDPPANAVGLLECSAMPKKTTRKRRDPESMPFDMPLPELPDVPADDPSQPEWVRDMRTWIHEVLPVSLRALSGEQTTKLAQYHAWRWANCTRDRTKNLKAAARIVVGIATLAHDRRYGGMTVDQYIDAADALWDQTGRRPMRSAWAVTSQVGISHGTYPSFGTPGTNTRPVTILPRVASPARFQAAS